jgi:hypothetical protein
MKEGALARTSGESSEILRSTANLNPPNLNLNLKFFHYNR